MTMQNGTTSEKAFDMSLLTATDTFDEVLPEPVRVSIIEFKNYETGDTLDDGAPVIIRRPTSRIALIGTYVPMKVLHGMMASQEKLKKMQSLQREAKAGALSEDGQQIMLEWMVTQVLAVWQLTEPNMTAEKLVEGLSYQKVFGLFGLFFGDLLKQLSK